MSEDIDSFIMERKDTKYTLARSHNRSISLGDVRVELQVPRHVLELPQDQLIVLDGFIIAHFTLFQLLDEWVVLKDQGLRHGVHRAREHFRTFNISLGGLRACSSILPSAQESPALALFDGSRAKLKQSAAGEHVVRPTAPVSTRAPHPTRPDTNSIHQSGVVKAITISIRIPFSSFRLSLFSTTNFSLVHQSIFFFQNCCYFLFSNSIPKCQLENKLTF